MFASVANKGGFENPGYMRGISCISIVQSPERYSDDDKRLSEEEEMMMMVGREKTVNTSNTSSSTSSIGKNSDLSGDSLDNNKNSEDSEEVQSSYKSPLDAMEALEEVLPIRRGISKFYNGKSKSFASLADAASVKELVKPESAHSKRRRNLLSHSFVLRSNGRGGGGISKRFHSSSRTTTLALAVAMNGSASSSSDTEMVSRSPRFRYCCVHPRVRELQEAGGSFPAWRSFSLTDLQDCAASATKPS